MKLNCQPLLINLAVGSPLIFSSTKNNTDNAPLHVFGASVAQQSGIYSPGYFAKRNQRPKNVNLGATYIKIP